MSSQPGKREKKAVGTPELDDESNGLTVGRRSAKSMNSQFLILVSSLLGRHGSPLLIRMRSPEPEDG
jgi:hypothetical protein